MIISGFCKSIILQLAFGIAKSFQSYPSAVEHSVKSIRLIDFFRSDRSFLIHRVFKILCGEKNDYSPQKCGE